MDEYVDRGRTGRRVGGSVGVRWRHTDLFEEWAWDRQTEGSVGLSGLDGDTLGTKCGRVGQ